MDNLITIGQAAGILKCNTSLLRFYEKEFEIDITRTSSNRRMYSAKDIESFRYIAKLKDKGYSNSQIKSVLNSERVNRVENFAQVQLETLRVEENIGSIETLRTDPEAVDLNEEIQAAGDLQPPITSSDIIAIFNVISQLRDEINELKNMESVRGKNELMEENARLKAKIKEKTYELVEVREKLSLAGKKAQKRSLFGKL